jgi:Mn-dependent DtxR family transcriptional regulator
MAAQPSPSRRRPSIRRSESTEDHLERISELLAATGQARVSDIAESLGLKRSTVSNMVRRLAERGYVEHEPYRGLALTAEGRAVARHVRKRHEILTALLEQLGLKASAVQAEVEEIEHHLSPATLALFGSLVEFWRRQPARLDEFLKFHRGGNPG